MLRNTFSHMHGVGVNTEKRLWREGFSTWNDLIDNVPVFMTPLRHDVCKCELKESCSRLERKDAGYFAGRLPANAHWRLIKEFGGELAFLDIETTGLDNCEDHITTIALYDGTSLRYYVYGQNLEEFGKDIEKYKIIVTYNGKSFDVPFIRRCLGLTMEQINIDLRYVLRKVGHAGGMKKCEKSFGIDRGALDGLDGFEAVLLWQEYQESGNTKMLETLLAYNMLDAINLEVLAVHAYNALLRKTGLDSSGEISLPREPQLPFHADITCVEKIRSKMYR